MFGDHPDAIANTMRIAERCNVQIPKGEAHLPNFQVPPGYTIESYFEAVVREGFAARMPRLRALEARGEPSADRSPTTRPGSRTRSR